MTDDEFVAEHISGINRDADQAAFSRRLRKLMTGRPDSQIVMQGIKEIIDERIAELNAKHEQRIDDGNGTASGPEPESG